MLYDKIIQTAVMWFVEIIEIDDSFNTIDIRKIAQFICEMGDYLSSNKFKGDLF